MVSVISESVAATALYIVVAGLDDEEKEDCGESAHCVTGRLTRHFEYCFVVWLLIVCCVDDVLLLVVGCVDVVLLLVGCCLLLVCCVRDVGLLCDRCVDVVWLLCGRVERRGTAVLVARLTSYSILIRVTNLSSRFGSLAMR